ncbi:type III-B CRISPR module-associated protein Cmr3 [Acidiphilium sp.]|uniref:type III-B CRISPR module-associated protein Cmr3 n=1 Tax=Acidiphilium sp. TaxID=527 RepID=UPI0025863461|nr:type III-B CRISPR module-associated protein Cmr3 [Acidiphilium sp.]
MTTTMTTFALSLTPLDLLFFRDGRPFDAAARVRSGLPQPQTVAGAVRTWLLANAGCDFDRLGNDIKAGISFAHACAGQGPKIANVSTARFRGPWFSRDGKTPILPMPATLRRRKDDKNHHQLIRLDPLAKPPPGWRSENGLLPLWYRGHETIEPVGGYLTSEGVAKFLAGGVPETQHCVNAAELYAEDRRSSVAISPRQFTAAPGQIFSVGFLALKPGVSLLIEVDLVGDEEIPGEGVIRLGGEGRQAHLRRLSAPIIWPRADAGEAQRIFLLTTPSVFPGGWKPAALSPLAAAVPAPIAVSGWDLARGGPKPTRFAVPAGAVYYVKDTASTAEDLFQHDQDSASGSAHALEGVWNYA